MLRCIKPAQIKPETNAVSLANQNYMIGTGCKYLNKDIKKGVAEPLLQFSTLKYPFLRTFHKRSDKFLHFTPNTWEQSQNPESSHPSLIQLYYPVC